MRFVINGQVITVKGGNEGGTAPTYIFGHGLKQVGDTVSVNSVDSIENFEGDATLPISANAVINSLGAVEAVLKSI